MSMVADATTGSRQAKLSNTWLAPITKLKNCRHGRMLFLTQDLFIGRALDLYGEFSELEGKLFDYIVDPGEVVVEVGANMGAHTLRFARLVGKTGEVHAFEPQRVIFQILCANIALNELFHARTYHAAAGNRTGTISVPIPDYTKEANFGGLALQAERGGEHVQLVRLDDLHFSAVHLIKVDVEGMEADVILGAQQTIKKFRPMLYVENDRQARSKTLIQLLETLGYDMWWHLPRMFNPENFARNPNNVFGRIVSVNLFCIPRERAEKMKVSGLRKVSGPTDWWKDWN